MQKKKKFEGKKKEKTEEILICFLIFALCLILTKLIIQELKIQIYPLTAFKRLHS